MTDLPEAVTSTTGNMQEPIAVVGYSYRAPGVGRKDLFEYLAAAKSAWSTVPPSRFNYEVYYHADQAKSGFISSQGAHFLPDDVYEFDAAFFNLKADEARAMDPQHRLILECAFEAVESAGIRLSDLAGSRTGVFSSIDPSDYNMHKAEDLYTGNKFCAIGQSSCMFANRVSHFFDLRGPSIAVDGACASSTEALHLACQSLRTGECHAAIVSGAKIIVSPSTWTGLDTMGATSAEGRCFSYDSRASGFGRGEGAASLIVKRLSDALAAGDPIRGVIRSTACNHSGRSPGISAPSRVAQIELLQQLHANVGLNPEDTTFVEGHGTGTPAGDPVEAGAFATVIGSSRSPEDPLYIGSVKSNFGHLEGASGILGMIKGLLMLEHDVLLPNADFRQMATNIEGREKLRVLQQTISWPDSKKRRICLTNFGFGGSNAAVLLESSQQATKGSLMHVTDHGKDAFTKEEACESRLSQRLFVFSAKSAASLTSYLESFATYMQQNPSSESFSRSLAFTLGQRRTHFAHRAAVAADTPSLHAKIASLARSNRHGTSESPVIAFAFTGQGAQYAQMAVGLQRYRAFAAALLEAERHLESFGASWSLSEELTKSRSHSRIDDVEISQPACTAIQLALVNLLGHWGVEPSHVLGHSSGEIAAAYAAGIVSFRAAMAIAYFRGLAAAEILRDESVRGAMLAVGTSAEEAATLLPDDGGVHGYATIAAVNSPSAVTISGDKTAIERIQQAAEAKGLFVRKLNVGVAYHSSHMERVAASYKAAIALFCGLENAGLDKSAVKFVSSVTGQGESSARVGADYWVQNLVSPVMYSAAVKSLFASDQTGYKAPNILVEIGPHPALKNPTKQIIQSLQTVNSAPKFYLPSLSRDANAEEAVNGLAASLYERRVDFDFAKVNSDCAGAAVLTSLPAYEWTKSRLIDLPRIVQEKLHNGLPYDTMLGWKSPYAEGGEQTFRNVFSLDEMPWLRDHNIEGEILFPFTGFITQAIRAFRALYADLTLGVAVRELYIKRALRIEEDQRVDITTKLRPAETGTEVLSSTTWKFEILTWSEGKGWVSHCHGLIEAESQSECSSVPVTKIAAQALEDIKCGKATHLEAEAEYGIMRESGLLYGSAFSRMTSLWEFPDDDSILVGEIELGDFHESNPRRPSPVTVDAPTLDACLHLASRIQGPQLPRPMCIPSHVNRLRISNKIPSVTGDKATFVAKLHHRDEKSGDMRISCVTFAHVGEERIPVAATEEITFKCIARPQAEKKHDTAEHWTTEYLALADVIDKAEPAGDSGQAQRAATVDDQSIVVCGQFEEEGELEFAEQVAEALEQHTGRACAVQDMYELDLSESPFCVFLDSRGRSILTDLDPQAFEMLKTFALDAAGIFWVSPVNATPEAHFIEGFLRTLRLEDPMKNFLLLGNVPADVGSIEGIKLITDRLLSSDESFRWEQEFKFEDGIIKVPRLKKMPPLEDPATSRVEQKIWQSNTAFELSAETIGDPSSIYFRRTNVLAEELNADSIIVRMEAAGVNFRDLLLVLGTMPWHAPGLEGAGTVHAVGSNVKHLQPGDPVFYVTREGGHANFVRISSSYACRRPQSLGAVEAAAMPIAFSTAIICLMRIGRLTAGESVLIHAASGAVGQACIMIAQHLGARIFATAGTEEKRNLLHDTFNIPRSQIFSSRTNDFRDGILTATNGQGVDVIVNSLSGQLLQDTWELIAEFGRFVEIGKKDLLQNSYLGMKPFARNVTYSGVDCREMFRNKPAMVRELLQEVVSLWKEKVIRPIQPITETPVSQITTALRKLQSGQNIGKIVVTMGEDEKVLAESPALEMNLQKDATYVITGGTGGIGRSLAVWLAENGAASIVLLGRSGSSTPKVAELLKRYEGSTVRLRAVACHVGSRQSVVDALRLLEEENFPKIRGVIHGAFYLRDAMFLNSSHSDWTSITSPKINGAWNMHSLCPDLDFFVILASGAGLVGHFGQSIYAGTTTFLDAFSRHRNSLNLPTVSISLPAVEGIGIVHERNMAESLNVTLGMMLPEREVYEEVKAAIIGPSSGRNVNGTSYPIMPPNPSATAPAGEMEWQKHGMFTSLRLAHNPSARNPISSTPQPKTQGFDTVETLVEALRAKVSAMTMLHIDDTTAERDLQDFGLDSLVSGELRSWIRREVGVEMSLPRIVGARNLRALAKDALRCRE